MSESNTTAPNIGRINSESDESKSQKSNSSISDTQLTNTKKVDKIDIMPLLYIFSIIVLFWLSLYCFNLADNHPYEYKGIFGGIFAYIFPAIAGMQMGSLEIYLSNKSKY